MLGKNRIQDRSTWIFFQTRVLQAVELQSAINAIIVVVLYGSSLVLLSTVNNSGRIFLAQLVRFDSGSTTPMATEDPRRCNKVVEEMKRLHQTCQNSSIHSFQVSSRALCQFMRIAKTGGSSGLLAKSRLTVATSPGSSVPGVFSGNPGLPFPFPSGLPDPVFLLGCRQILYC